MGGLHLVPAELGGILIESFIYGMYVIMFSACMYVLVGRQLNRPKERRKPLNKPLVAACVVLFMSITTHWFLNMIRAFHAFVREGHKPDGPLNSFGKLSDPLNVTKTGLYMFDIVIGDLIMVYRLWIVWNHNKLVCAPPALCVLAVIATGTGITYQFTQLQPDQDVFLSQCGRWITSSWSLTLATNVYSTSMLSYKIWNINRAVKRLRSSTTMYIMVIVIESAAIYTAFSFSAMVSYLSKSNMQFLILNACNPVIGLVFCMIIVRVGLGLGDKHVITTALPVDLGDKFSSGSGMGLNGSRALQGNVHPLSHLKPISVNVSTHIDTAIDDDMLPRRHSQGLPDGYKISHDESL